MATYVLYKNKINIFRYYEYNIYFRFGKITFSSLAYSKSMRKFVWIK